MTSARDYLVNVLAQMISRAVSMGASFAALVLFARIRGTESFGELAFLMAFILFGSVAAEFGTTGALAVGLVEKEEQDRRAYLGNFLLLRIMLALLAILISLPISTLIRPDLIDLLFVASLSIPFIGARVFETVYQIYGRPLYSVVTSLYLGLAQIGVAVLLLLIIKVGIEGYMYGYVVVQITYFLFTFVLIIRLVSPRFSIHKKTFLDILSVATPMGIWSIFNAVSSRADIFMLSYFRTAHEVGIYNAAYRLLDLGTVVAATVAVPLVPVLSRKFGTDPKLMRDASAKVFELTTICIIPLPILLMFVSPQLVALVFGEAFSDSAIVLPIFGWLFFLLVLMYIGNAVNLSSDNIRHSAWSAVLAATVNVLANLYLIPRFGILGAAWSSAISTGLMLTVSLSFVHMRVGSIFNAQTWRKILLAALVPCVYLFLTPGVNILLRLSTAISIYLVLVLALRLLPFGYLVQNKVKNHR